MIVYAQTVARAVSFPSLIEIRYHEVNNNGVMSESFYLEGVFPWEQVINHFRIDNESAAECERDFKRGMSAKIREPRTIDLERDRMKPGSRQSVDIGKHFTVFENAFSDLLKSM